MGKIEVDKIATLQGHQDCVYTLIEGAKNKNIISAGGDGMVAQWDLSNPKDGELIAKVDNSVYALYLDKSKNLYVGHNYEGIHLINLESKKELNSVKLGTEAIFDIQSTEKLPFIIVACGSGLIKIVEKDGLRIIHTIQASKENARCIIIDEENLLFYVGFSDNYIRQYSLQNFNLKKEVLSHDNSVFGMTSSKGKLYSVARDAKIKKWSLPDFALEEDVPAHMYAINHITMNQHQDLMVTGSMDKSIKIWDSESLKLLKVIDKNRSAGHGTSVNKLVWSSYNDYIVSASDDRNISVWKLNI